MKLPVRLAALVLLFVISSASQAQAHVFQIDALYDDGTTFTAVFDDDDGLCTGCSLVSASATLGIGGALETAVDVNANPFTLNLGDLLANLSATLNVSVLSPAGFFFAASNPDSSAGPNGYPRESFFATAEFAQVENAVCDTYNSGECVASTFYVGRADTVSVSIRQVPEPTTLALMGLGLAGIGYSRKRKAT